MCASQRGFNHLQARSAALYTCTLSTAVGYAPQCRQTSCACSATSQLHCAPRGTARTVRAHVHDASEYRTPEARTGHIQRLPRVSARTMQHPTSFGPPARSSTHGHSAPMLTSPERPDTEAKDARTRHRELCAVQTPPPFLALVLYTTLASAVDGVRVCVPQVQLTILSPRGNALRPPLCSTKPSNAVPPASLPRSAAPARCSLQVAQIRTASLDGIAASRRGSTKHRMGYRRHEQDEREQQQERHRVRRRCAHAIYPAQRGRTDRTIHVSSPQGRCARGA
ncbi:hypothetical protein C2E23DRAFT_544011 [Lenzites betulinus]|nr:hypothetical protein C2E23DRAFT_544011 [Lenzites betulinus]